jgi:hypothetical protein
VPTSCKKEPIQYDFDGVIKNSVTNNGIAGVDITISQKIVKNGSTSNTYSFAGATATDASGAFEISFEREMVTEFLLEFEKEDYFTLELIESSSNVSTGEINTYNELLEPKAWVTFNIKNFLPDEGDHFRLIMHSFKEGCLECATATTLNLFGAVDTSITYATTAGEYARFTYIDVTYSDTNVDSIYMVPFENNSYTINY